MAKLEFTVSLFGDEAACKKLAKTMQTNIELSWARANPRKPTTRLLIGKNKVDASTAEDTGSAEDR